MSALELLVLAVVVGIAVAPAPPASASDAPASTKERLDALSRRAVFFGHQSVGGDVLAGVEALAASAGVPLRVAELGEGARVAAGILAHRKVPENGKPLLKLQGFAQAFESGAAAGADVALVKFCYVDVQADTDVRALFAAYQRTLAELRDRNPGTTFVHATVPLTTVLVQGGWKGLVKRLLGRSTYTWGFEENRRRDEYNALLRAAYAGREPIFDIARVESTRPDGRAETFEWQGRVVPALVASYTDDGGHLNAEGRARAARELVSVLATAPPAGRAAGSSASR